MAEELYRSMLPAFSKDGGMDEKGIRDALKRETERMALKEETPLARVLDLRLLKKCRKNSDDRSSRSSGSSRSSRLRSLSSTI